MKPILIIEAARNRNYEFRNKAERARADQQLINSLRVNAKYDAARRRHRRLSRILLFESAGEDEEREGGESIAAVGSSHEKNKLRNLGVARFAAPPRLAPAQRFIGVSVGLCGLGREYNTAGDDDAGGGEGKNTARSIQREETGQYSDTPDERERERVGGRDHRN